MRVILVRCLLFTQSGEAKNLLFFSYQPMRNHFNLSNGNTSSINLFTCPG